VGVHAGDAAGLVGALVGAGDLAGALLLGAGALVDDDADLPPAPFGISASQCFLSEINCGFALLYATGFFCGMKNPSPSGRKNER
jgi:hypothetical protein